MRCTLATLKEKMMFLKKLNMDVHLVGQRTAHIEKFKEFDAVVSYFLENENFSYKLSVGEG